MSDPHDTDPFVPIPGCSRYRVRASDGKVQSSIGKGRHHSPKLGEWIDLKGGRDFYGYQAYVLIGDDGTKVRMLGHVIVAITFLGPCPEGREVCHKDDVKSNNSLSNLYYGTRKENVADAFRNGGWGVGSRHSQAKLNEDIVRDVRRRTLKWGDQTRIAAELGVAVAVVNGILKGRTWKHVS